MREEGQSALAVRMGRNEPEVEPGYAAQQLRPDEVPPHASQKKKDEEGEADADRPPAGGSDPVALRPILDRPGGHVDRVEVEVGQGCCKYRTGQADEFRSARIASVQRLRHVACGLRRRGRRDDRSAHELRQSGPQATLDLLFRQNESANADEEFRPYSGVREIGILAVIEGEAARNSEQEGYAPGQRNEKDRSRSRPKRVFPKQLQLRLQLEKRPAMRRAEIGKTGRGGFIYRVIVGRRMCNTVHAHDHHSSLLKDRPGIAAPESPWSIHQRFSA
ncbi:hypothetical protein [Sinorhizobium meliloti]|uniref:hypothetical protein n=1 Tax=Rhizobium meliloti TaxID=382 RepID=UPI000474EDE7|nr:hypothetical protein [Sinorhizobium meliloti]MDE4552972.1 hypothetical protein [Sinorhizobium meliloti]